MAECILHLHWVWTLILFCAEPDDDARCIKSYLFLILKLTMHVLSFPQNHVSTFVISTCFDFKMVTRNLQLFNNQLQSKQPLFQIETVLSAPEIGLSPPANEIYKLIMQSVRDMVEG